MNDSTVHTEPNAVTKVARNLTAIEDLATTLDAQAIHKANDRLMPGGLAMVALAGVANLEAWESIFEGAEAYNATEPRTPKDLSHIDDEDDDWEPPLQTICFWSERWRAVHGYEIDRQPNLATEISFVRWALNWAWENEPGFEQFASEIHQARFRLEDVLHAGRRAQRVRVHCTNDDCPTQPRLIVVHGEDATQDRFKCPRCKHLYDEDDYQRAYANQLRSTGAERFVKVADAVGTLRAQGRSERTIRKWFENCEVQAYCNPITHEVWAWWPDLWRLHLTTQTRKSTRGKAAA